MTTDEQTEPTAAEPDAVAASPELVDVPEFIDEEVIFRKDGTVTLKIDGTRYRLRRPKWRELRALRESAQQNTEDYNDATHEVAERMAAMLQPSQDALDAIAQYAPDETAAPDAPDDAPDGVDGAVAALTAIQDVQASVEFRALQAEMRALRAKGDDTVMGWFYTDIVLLLAKPSPRFDADDLPPWVIDPKFIGDLLAHWSSVPRRPGVL